MYDYLRSILTCHCILRSMQKRFIVFLFCIHTSINFIKRISGISDYMCGTTPPPPPFIMILSETQYLIYKKSYYMKNICLCDLGLLWKLLFKFGKWTLRKEGNLVVWDESNTMLSFRTGCEWVLFVWRTHRSLQNHYS